MALRTCRECGGSVSSSARRCPHCGKRNPTTSPITYIVVAAIFIAGFVAIIATINGGSNNRRYSSTYPKTYNDAYKEYQNGNTKPLEDFHKWLEKNP